MEWDRERGFVKPVSEFPLADLYICWDKKSIYLGLYSQDIVENELYRNKIVPESDRAKWTVTLAGNARPIHALIGAGLKPAVDGVGARIANLSGVDLTVRNIAALELPAKLFGRKQFQTGDEVEFSSTLFTHCRADRTDWSGRFILR